MLLRCGLVRIEDHVQTWPVETEVLPMEEMMILMVLLYLVRLHAALVAVFVSQLVLQEPVSHEGRREPQNSHQENVVHQVEPLFWEAGSTVDVGIPGGPIWKVVVQSVRMLVHTRKVFHPMNVIEETLPRQDRLLHEVVDQWRDACHSIQCQPGDV